MAEKVIKIDDREVKFIVNGLTPVTYMSEQGRDFLGDFIKMENGMKGKIPLDTMCFYNIAYITAKSADNEIGTLEEWLESFENGFPIFEVVGELMPLLQLNFKSNKVDKLVRKK